MVDNGKFDPKEHLKNLNTDSQGNPRKPERWYLECKWRLCWLRQEHPDAQIETEVISVDDKMAVVHARVTTPQNAAVATGLGTAPAAASGRFSGRYVEKAETAALARALAGLGYGTQFTGAEFEDGDYISDTPPEAKRPTRPLPPPVAARSMPTPGDAPATGRILDNQRKAIRASLSEIFGKDERAQCEWMAKIMPAALNDNQTEIHLSPLTQDEAKTIIFAANAEKVRKPAVAKYAPGEEP